MRGGEGRGGKERGGEGGRGEWREERGGREGGREGGEYCIPTHAGVCTVYPHMLVWTSLPLQLIPPLSLLLSPLATSDC